ncbi:MAG: N-acetylmuramoyl-L-alanine amidase [Candidatus Aenigmatarchaeota archaeon]
MRKINKIIIHCTDSDWGNIDEIRRWHIERGFSDVGYHYIIYNGYLTYKSWKERKRNEKADGLVVLGRDVERIGSHCVGHNKDSIGIALVGTREFTRKQFISLRNLIEELLEKYDLTRWDVYGHSYFNPNKTCPNFDVKLIWRLDDERDI